MLKKYRFGFDPMGLMVFLLVMLPNFIWFTCPAPNDVLRAESITPVWDGIASVCQVAMTGLLCMLIHQERKPLRLSPLIIASGFFLLLYYTCWIIYFTGITHPPVILGLTLPPCLVFLLFALDRKNYPALGGGFLRNHLSNNKQTGIRHSDARLLMWSPNAMHRNGAYNCALLRGRKSALVCSTNWNLYY